MTRKGFWFEFVGHSLRTRPGIALVMTCRPSRPKPDAQILKLRVFAFEPEGLVPKAQAEGLGTCKRRHGSKAAFPR